MTAQRLLICIPCYNEQDNIIHTIEEVRQAVKELPHIQTVILVINDGSNDNSLECIQSLNTSVISLPFNLGIGAAIQTGFTYANKNAFDFFIQVDGDGQHDASYIKNILEPIQKEAYDICIGSRYLEKKGFQSSFIRQIGIRWFSNLIYVLTKQRIMDTTSGFRAFNKIAIQQFAVEYPEKYPEPEILLTCAFNKLNIKEVPVQMRKRIHGSSSIGAFASLYYIFSVTLGILFSYIQHKTRPT